MVGGTQELPIISDVPGGLRSDTPGTQLYSVRLFELDAKSINKAAPIFTFFHVVD